MSGIPIDFESHQRLRVQTISDSVNLIMGGVVPGDIAEFGVGQGTSLMAIASTLRYCEAKPNWARFLGTMPRKTIHAFDSFQGLPASRLEGDVDSPMVQSGVWAEGTCPSPGLETIQSMVGQFLPADRVKYHAGWFDQTLQAFDPQIKLALVHVDCDLYESTRTVLSNLFGMNRLSDGCVILFDDFLNNRASKRFGQRKALEECRKTYNPDLTDLGPYGMTCWRFIYHAP